MSQYVLGDDVSFITHGWWQTDPDLLDTLQLVVGRTGYVATDGPDLHPSDHPGTGKTVTLKTGPAYIAK